MKLPLDGLHGYLDRLGEPLLFVEERELRLARGEVKSVSPGLPKMLCILEGEMRCGFGGEKPFEVGPGVALIHTGPSVQYYQSAERGRGGCLRVLRLTFMPERVVAARSVSGDGGSWLEFCLHRLPVSGWVATDGIAGWGARLGELRQAVRVNRPESRHRAHGLAQQLLLELALSISEPGAVESGQDLVEKIESCLDTHLGEDLRLSDVARLLDRTEEHLCRVYRRNRGRTIFEELKRRRLEKAKYLLLCSEYPVGRIALECGFSTSALFSRSFRESVGMSPREFRSAQLQTPTAG